MGVKIIKAHSYQDQQEAHPISISRESVPAQSQQYSSIHFSATNKMYAKTTGAGAVTDLLIELLGPAAVCIHHLESEGPYPRGFLAYQPKGLI